MLIETKDIRKDYGGNVVLDGAELRIVEGEKVGLVGRNGAGKSTLLNIICGLDDDYSGTCRKASDRRIVLVGQYFPDFKGSASEFVASEALALRQRLRGLEERMADPLALDGVLSEYAKLRERYDLIDGDGAEERAVRFLESVGLAGIADRPCSVLSGGEKNVLALANAMNGKPDLLVLDEPGNHLDVWGLAWLESFLAGIPQAVLIVSHNRYLLDRVATRIVELENGKTASYAGGWSAFRMEKLRKGAAQGLDWKADQRKLEKLEEMVRRFAEIARAHPDPAWGKRVRASRSRLERAKAEAIERPDGDGKALEVDFRADPSKADIAIDVDGYTKGFPGRPELFRDAKLLIRSGERVALVGPNGSGKTTFLTDLVAKGNWDNAELRIGPSFTLGWCGQQQEVFGPENTVRDEFLRLGAFSEDEIFGVLRRFLFARADLDKKISSLSGGERNRLQLARVVMLKADLLILDEPTNHLDIPAREAVEEALAEFKGTLLVVSHDRYFLDKVVGRVAELDGEGGFTTWDGNFSEFWYRAYGSAGARLSRPSADEGTGSGLETRGKNLERNKRDEKNRKPDPRRKANAATEARLIMMEAERTDLESASARAVGSGDFKEGRRLGNALAELSRRIEKLYEEWKD